MKTPNDYVMSKEMMEFKYKYTVFRNHDDTGLIIAEHDREHGETNIISIDSEHIDELIRLLKKGKKGIKTRANHEK